MSQDRVYRYHAFGVPELGLQRGLGRDLVVAPYATALALTTRPAVAVRNLTLLEELGVIGRYGFYHAIDFTPERVRTGKRFAFVRAYIAHHNGQPMRALGNPLFKNLHVRWFNLSAPRVGNKYVSP